MGSTGSSRDPGSFFLVALQPSRVMPLNVGEAGHHHWFLGKGQWRAHHFKDPTWKQHTSFRQDLDPWSCLPAGEFGKYIVPTWVAMYPALTWDLHD